MSESLEPVIVYASCQGAILGWIFNHCATIQTKYKFLRFDNYPDRSETSRAIPMDVRARCPIFIHAMGAWGRECEAFEGLPSTCAIIHIPTPFTTSLFPLSRPWPVTPPLIPRRFELAYEFCDKVAVELIESGLNKTDYLKAYFATDMRGIVDSARLQELDLHRLKQQDALCHFPIVDYVAKRFRSQKLFHTLGHLTDPFHFHMARETLAAFVRQGIPFMVEHAGAIRAEMDLFERTTGPLHSEVQVPIHGQIAEMLQLDWYDHDTVYDNREFGRWTTGQFMEFLYDYVKY